MLVEPEYEGCVLLVPAAFSAVAEQGCRDFSSQHVLRRVAVFVGQNVESVSASALMLSRVSAHVGHPHVGDKHTTS